uniref:Uncharacterized protein n=1 Tax=Oryza glaberrima TaxID=4538 RepID=I1P4B7_ORYGL
MAYETGYYQEKYAESTSLCVMALERTVWYSMAFVTAGLLRKPPVSPQSHAALPTSPSPAVEEETSHSLGGVWKGGTKGVFGWRDMGG